MNLFIPIEQKAYIAGMMDGEGTICITKKYNPYRNRLFITYISFVTITNTHKGVLEWIQDKTCIGAIYEGKRTKSNWKKSYQWHVSVSQQVEFLKIILPYLIIKKKQAEIIIEYQNSRIHKPAINKPIPEEITQKFEKFYQEVSELNMRGV